MKKNRKGFTLIETLLVSTFIIGILIFLFSEFAKLKKSYDSSFENNAIPALYKARNINRFLYSTEGSSFIQYLEDSDSGYLEITDCPTNYLKRSDYCKQLFKDLDVVTVFVSKETTFKTDLQEDLKNNTDGKYSEKLYRFVKGLSINNENYDGYRIIVEFEDEQYATVALSH
jgi:competence protein ComGC